MTPEIEILHRMISEYRDESGNETIEISLLLKLLEEKFNNCTHPVENRLKRVLNQVCTNCGTTLPN